MKFLILWELDHPPMTPALVQAVLRMPDYAKDLAAKGKLDKRYHVVGRHGGAWIYDVDSNEELERLLAAAPAYNYARYEVYRSPTWRARRRSSSRRPDGRARRCICNADDPGAPGSEGRARGERHSPRVDDGDDGRVV